MSVSSKFTSSYNSIPKRETEVINARFRSPGAAHVWYWDLKGMEETGEKGLFEIPNVYFGSSIEKGPNKNVSLKKGTIVTILTDEESAQAVINKVYFRIDTTLKKPENRALYLDIDWIQRGKKIPEPLLMPISSLQSF